MAPLQLPTEPRPPRAHFPAVSRSPRDTILQSERPPLPTELHREPRRVRLALAGCGVVGGGLIRLLHETAPSPQDWPGVDICIWPKADFPLWVVLRGT